MKAPDTIYIELITLVVNTAERLDSDVGYTRSDISHELAKTVEAQKAEIARLTKCLSVANANHERFERLWYLGQQALETYGRHTMACSMMDHYEHSTDCTCGFRAALRGEV